jgi:enoyl-CoA hydratase
MPPAVRTTHDGPVATILLDRPERRNAIDPATADALADAVRAADADDDVAAIVLTGAGAHFCAGADLQALAAGDVPDVGPEADGPLGPTRFHPDTPTIAAVEGYAVAGGLELACWCDLRVVAADAVFGVFNRRYGIPLVDGGTQRLPRIVGLGRALDLILTGRPVDAEEAKSMGLATRVVEPGAARADAEALAHRLAEVPQAGLRSDRAAVYEGLGTPIEEGLRAEARRGQAVADDGDLEAAARRFGDDPSDGPEATNESG